MTGSKKLERLRFSVIVASHHRPSWLQRCLTSLRQLDHDAFEIVVVADSHSLSALTGDAFKRVAFDLPNISQARNAGIAVAAGDICAFIDDDAVPEPLWLKHLEHAFHATGAAAVVGYVRGRNGISFQSRVASVDAEGETHQEHTIEEAPAIPDLKAGRALKLVGTNAAFRKDVLEKLNGFDPAYTFYLDDSDISLRLERSGFKAAVAPLAEVHHAFAPSSRRTALRAPTHLGDIGRSSAVYLRRHNGIGETELFERLQVREQARLVRHMVQGTCEPRDVQQLMHGLRQGWQAGLSMDLPEIKLPEDDKYPFMRVKRIKGHQILNSRLLRRRALLSEANALAESGRRVSFFSFSLTPVRHLVRYSGSGVWVQTGGQFGRTDRNGPVFKWCRFANRMDAEIRRVAKQRGI
ncbi:MAG: glycosyltransferase family 2 protein [Silicimonas sp.]|nr:glycosyltransferase family 2 protein [Silicimonas sp.]